MSASSAPSLTCSARPLIGWAVRAAVSARNTAIDPLVIGLASGAIYLASIGHPRHAKPDVLGSTVNTAFRVNRWTSSHVKARIGASFGAAWAGRIAFHATTHAAVVLD